MKRGERSVLSVLYDKDDSGDCNIIFCKGNENRRLAAVCYEVGCGNVWYDELFDDDDTDANVDDTNVSSYR